MKIPFFNIHIGRAENKTTPAKVLTKVVQTQLTRSRSQVKNWIDATTAAESIYQPNRMELIRIYNNIAVDGHLSALANVLKLRIAGAPLKFVTASGETDEKATAIVATTWFRQICEMYVDAFFYGYTLAQIVEIDGENVVFEFVPREYVSPEFKTVKTSVGAMAKSGISITDSEFAPSFIYCDFRSLGIFHKAAPLVITKRAVTGAWSEYCEIFGMPIRIGKTNINVPANYNNMRTMLENMGSAAFAVIDDLDKIEFVETSKTDAFQVFDQFINRQNSELSKLFLGQTGTTDEKAFTGSANVHADILDSIVVSHIQGLCNWINSDVINKLQKYKLLPPSVKIAPAGEIRLTVEQKVDAISKLSDAFDIDPEWISTELGIPVEKKEPAAPGVKNRADVDINAIVNELYFGKHGRH